MSETQDFGATAPPLPAGYEPVFDLGFNAHLGTIYRKLASLDGDPHHYLFDVGPHHLNTGGFTHGGVLMSLADVVLGSTVAHSVGFMCSTISLNCDFLAGAKLGDRIEGSATITRQTRSVAFVTGTLSLEGNVLMTASGVWKILQRGGSS